MTLPPALHLYFAARTPEALAPAFSPTAQVQDEGHTHQGPEAIAAWWAAARAKYRHSAAPLDLTEAHGRTEVRARVTGDFPGSPLVLRFSFGMEGALIRGLRISV